MSRRISQLILPAVLLASVLLLLGIFAFQKCQPRESLPLSLSLPLPLNFPSSDPLPFHIPELIPRPLPIWIVEASGRSERTPCEMCAVESAALHHPNTTVYLLLTSPYLNSKQIMEMMTMYTNIQPRYLNLDTLFSSSPLSHLWESGQVHNSNWPVSHLSDLIRCQHIMSAPLCARVLPGTFSSTSTEVCIWTQM